MTLEVEPGRYRILSLDGGGTFCLLQAKVLADLYPGESGHEILHRFDLVAGCSGGAIVAAALIDGMRPADIVDLFLDRRNRERLFSPLHWRDKLIRLASRTCHRLGCLSAPFGPRFSTARKLDFLYDILPNAGRTHLGGLSAAVGGPRHTDFMFVTYDYDRDRTRMMRSRINSAAANFPRNGSETTLAEAVHASSTAPINWFHEPATIGPTRYWDGAMTSYNNPVLASVTEAMAMGARPADIRVLSLGTSTVFPKAPGGEGFADSLVKVANLIITDPPDSQTFIAHVVLGGGLPDGQAECPCGQTHVVRMSPVVQKVYAPDTRRFGWPSGWDDHTLKRLLEMDIAATEDADARLIVRLADEWMAGAWNNQPVRVGGQLFDAMHGACDGVPAGEAASILCEIGHPRYGVAKQAWLALSA